MEQLAEPMIADFEAVIPDHSKAAVIHDQAFTEYTKSKVAATGGDPEEDVKETTGYTGRAKKASVTKATFEADSPNPERYWYESESDSRMFNDFTALRLAGHDTNLMVVGPSGFGKTEGIIRLGQRLGVPVHVVNCQVITTTEKWLGQMTADPVKGTVFEVSQHLKWVERDTEECQNSEFCILLYDEITRLRPELSNPTLSLLDGQQGLEVPQMGRRVVMSPKNVVFATANIGSAYSGTFSLDWALRGRFDTTMERPFPPTDEELKVIMTASPKLDEKAARGMIAVAEHSRILWREGELEAPISTRLLLSWARWVAGGYSVKDAAEYTILPVYSEDGGIDSDRAKLKQAIDGKVEA
jgi:MoxR-like ATPase